MSITYLLGRNARAYFNTAGALIGSIGTGPSLDEYIADWLDDADTIEADNMTNVDYDMGSEMADATTRLTARQGFASNIPVLKNGQITFEMRWLPNDNTTTSFTYWVLNAWQTDGRIGMVFLDYPMKAGSDGLAPNPGPGNTVKPQGLAANWSVSLTKAEALNDVQRASVTLSIADAAKWYLGAAIIGS